MLQGIHLGTITVDCFNEDALCRFYQALLGGTQIRLYDHAALVSECGIRLLFIQERDFVPCTWPEMPGAQQKQIHLDFVVDDLPHSVYEAEALGAVKTSEQFGSEHSFVTFLDPAGHPFCLCAKD